MTQPYFSNQNLKPLNSCLLLLLLNYQSLLLLLLNYQSLMQYYYCHSHYPFYSQCSAHVIKWYNLNKFSSISAVLLSLLSLFLLFISFFRNTNYSQLSLLLFYLHISGHWTHLLFYVCILSQPEFANNIFKFYKLYQKITKFKMKNKFQVQYVIILTCITYLPYYNSLRHFVNKSNSYRNDFLILFLVKYSKLIAKYY